MPEPQTDALGRFVGGGLIAMGAAMALLGGGCSLWWLSIAIHGLLRHHSYSYPDNFAVFFLIVALAICSGLVMVGVMIFRAGLKHWRSVQTPPQNGVSDE